MHTEISSKTGYVYILTNPSFREDWIKIGKSSRPVDIRSKELDNTAVPLPFEIYATMKTSSYNKVEAMLHKILEGTHVRIRKNREFFNVKPEVALNAFYDIAELLSDAEVYIKGEEPSIGAPQKEKVKVEVLKKNQLDHLVEVSENHELPKGAKYTLDGTNFYSMAKFAYVFISRLITDIPSLTFEQLEMLFPSSILTGYKYCGIIVKKETLEASGLSPAVMKKAYRYEDDDCLLQTLADDIEFYTTTQWMRASFKKLIRIANSKGYQIFTKK